MLAMMNNIKTRESPEPTFQLLPCLNSCSITFPIRRILLPPRRSDITNVVRDGTKYHCDAADDSGNTKRHYDLKNSLRSVRTEISGSVDNIFINLRQHIVDRKYHKRKKIVYHSENNGRWSIDDRLLRKMEEIKYAVNDSVFSKSVCHANVRRRKFIHIGRMNISTIKLV